MNIDIEVYDCPTFEDIKPKRGVHVLTANYVNDSLLNLCDSISIKNSCYYIYKKVYNLDTSMCEIWLKGKYIHKDGN